MEEKAKKIAEVLKLLANEHRLLILCVGEIHQFTPGISSSALSQHLAQLKMAGILESEKQGMKVIYQIQDDKVIGLIDFLKKTYCG